MLVALLAGAVFAGGSFKDDFTVPVIESQRAQDVLEQRFPAQSGTQAMLVFTGRDLSRIDPALAGTQLVGAALLAGTVLALGVADRRGSAGVWIDLNAPRMSRA